MSISSDERNSTFCNIYSAEGISLSDIILSGQADVSNLFTALEKAEFDKGFSLENVKRDFAEGNRESFLLPITEFRKRLVIIRLTERTGCLHT